MKDYTLKAVSVTFETSEVLKNTLPSMVNNTNVAVIPTVAYEILKKEIKNGKDSFIYVNSFIEIVKTLYKFNKKELHSNYLQSITREYNKIIELLQPIIANKTFAIYNASENITENCSIYMMKPYNDLTFVRLIDNKVIETVEIDFDYENLKNTPLNNDNFINTLIKTKLDARSAIFAEYEYINSPEFDEDKNKYTAFISRVNSILNFLTYRKAGKAEKVDRVYSSFTSLSKISRKFLTINNKPFTEIDIKNCQPLLLAILIGEKGYDIDLSYIEDVQSGVFYEKLMNTAKEFNFIKTTIYAKGNFETRYFNKREDLKKICYNDIFFANVHKDTKLVKVFKSLYPKTHNTILKLAEEQTLAYLLQNLEAEIVLNIIPNSPYYTVHDAIYVSRTTEIKNTMKDIENIIYSKSGGLIKNVKFGEISKNQIVILDSIVKENVEVFDLLARAEHSIKNAKLHSFVKMIEQGMNKPEIMNVLKISESTYKRYKKELI